MILSVSFGEYLTLCKKMKFTNEENENENKK